jgi:hypothetical protein
LDFSFDLAFDLLKTLAQKLLRLALPGAIRSSGETRISFDFAWRDINTRLSAAAIVRLVRFKV